MSYVGSKLEHYSDYALHVTLRRVLCDYNVFLKCISPLHVCMMSIPCYINVFTLPEHLISPLCLLISCYSLVVWFWVLIVPFVWLLGIYIFYFSNDAYLPPKLLQFHTSMSSRDSATEKVTNIYFRN